MKQNVVAKESKLMKYMKAPIGILIQAKDLYVESWTGGAGDVTYGNAMGCPTPQPHSPISPLNFSPNSNSSTPKRDLKERPRSKSASTGGGGLPPPTPRRNTISIGRIDEDEPFEFGGEDVGLLKSKVVPRRRSYEQSRITKMV